MKYIKPAKLGRRVVALLFNLLILFTFAEGTFALATVPILGKHFGAEQLTRDITRLQLDSHLLVINNHTHSINARPEEEYPEAIYRYYVESDLATKPYSIDQYYDEILLRKSADTLFDFSTPVMTSTPWEVKVKQGKEADAKNFYKKAYQAAINDLEATTAFINLAKPLGDLQAQGHLITYAIFIFVFFLIIPSFTPHGATLGHLVMRLGFVTMYGFKMAKAHKPYRAVTSVLINFVGLFLLLPIISVVILTVRKDGRSLTDLAAGTLCVDTKESVIFNNIYEMEDFDAKRAVQGATIKKWRADVLKDEEEGD